MLIYYNIYEIRFISSFRNLSIGSKRPRKCNQNSYSLLRKTGISSIYWIFWSL